MVYKIAKRNSRFLLKSNELGMSFARQSGGEVCEIMDSKAIRQCRNKFRQS
jgi:hypothetical protein